MGFWKNRPAIVAEGLIAGCKAAKCCVYTSVFDDMVGLWVAANDPSRKSALVGNGPINVRRVELALCLCFCLAVNEMRGQRGALIANVGNRDDLPKGGARERADGEQPT
jgi:hypothetical protein